MWRVVVFFVTRSGRRHSRRGSCTLCTLTLALVVAPVALPCGGSRAGCGGALTARARGQLPMVLMARAARTATTVSEMVDWAISSSLAGRERTIVSVGLKAVEVLKARKR